MLSNSENQREASDAASWSIGQPALQPGAATTITAPSPTSKIPPACSPPSDLVNNLMADESVEVKSATRKRVPYLTSITSSVSRVSRRRDAARKLESFQKKLLRRAVMLRMNLERRTDEDLQSFFHDAWEFIENDGI